MTFDFPGFSIGVAERGQTGCTAFRFAQPLLGAIDVRGGAAAVSDGSALSLENTWGAADGLMFAGGSTYGLAAAEGAKAELMASRQSSDFLQIPSVPGAIVYDFGGRSDLDYPDVELGRQAWRAAVPGFVQVGAVGAGRNVSVAKISGHRVRSGQGAAFLERDGVKLFCLTVLNAAGSILDRNGAYVAGGPSFGGPTANELTAGAPGAGDLIASDRAVSGDPRSERGNTTISVLFTNARLDRIELSRLCASVHMGLGRVIQPYATPSDGDVFFAFSTAAIESPLSLSVLCDLGAWTAQEAVLSLFSVSKT